MVEYYGWICLSDSTYETNELAMKEILDKLNHFIMINKIESSSGFIKTHKVNGMNQLLVSGNTNHFSRDVIDVLGVYEFIGSVAKGSYGLLYIRDDESEDIFNEFEVFILARGKIRKEKDTFLSPCIPTIEDGDD